MFDSNTAYLAILLSKFYFKFVAKNVFKSTTRCQKNKNCELSVEIKSIIFFSNYIFIYVYYNFDRWFS